MSASANFHSEHLHGSSDIFEASGRAPQASINFITSHDGFTLKDLVSYEHKRNEENGEDNRDGCDANHSSNCGIEGPTDDKEDLAVPGLCRIKRCRKLPQLAGAADKDGRWRFCCFLIA